MFVDFSRGNDAEERSKRYRDFNLEALIAAATRSSRTNTKQCTSPHFLRGALSKFHLRHPDHEISRRTIQQDLPFDFR
jgi:hypothetical protein